MSWLLIFHGLKLPPMQRSLLSRLIPPAMWRDRRASVALMFGLSLIPLVAFVALAVDYSFYIQARSQLDLAADAAAMHAVRAASQAYALGYTTVAAEEQAGVQAGQLWFAAQLGTLGTGTIDASDIKVSVTYAPAPGTFTSSVIYTATVPLQIRYAAFLPTSWTASNTNSAATAVISNSYVEILLLLDDSSSMLIGSQLSDIVALEKATVCSTQGATEGQNIDQDYAWSFQPSTVGYPGSPGVQTYPTLSQQSGACLPGYDGDPAACFYIPPNVPAISRSTPTAPSTGLCTNGGGGIFIPAQPGGGRPAQPRYTPQAPCGFACHDRSDGSDYYGLARSLNPPITLRLDVVEQAAANVIQTLQNEPQQFPNQFSVGVYEFNSALRSVYPGTGSAEANTDLPSALQAVKTLAAVLSSNSNPANTYFLSSTATLAASLKPNGNGLSPATPQKNIFIVTDGVSDYYDAGGNRIQGTITDPATGKTCQVFKDLGITIYVLYTPYLPVPNPWYLQHIKSVVEPQGDSSPVALALQACASSPANYASASDPAAINAALQKMLLSALNSPGRISQ